MNALEVVYCLFLPVLVLKYFGAEIAGVYAVAVRLVTAALMGQDALILPLLSGGTIMFASGSAERLARFFEKAFKLTLGVTLVPLAFVGAFGTILVFAWTGQTSREFMAAIWLSCLSSFFGSISRLQLVLYRASGHALHDNIRQAFRLGALAVLAAFGRTMGFRGVLLGLAATELIGVIYMFSAMTKALRFFQPKRLIPDAIRLAGATAVIVGVGVAAVGVPTPTLWGSTNRGMAFMKLAEALLACVVASLPAIALTRAVSADEQRTVLSFLIPWRRAALLGGE